jgi:hypothetical protein
MTAADGKQRLIDVANTGQLLRHGELLGVFAKKASDQVVREIRDHVAQVSKVVYDFLVQLLVSWFLAVEQQERIDEEGKIDDQRNVECTEFFQSLFRHTKDVGEVKIGVFHGSFMRLLVQRRGPFRERMKDE